MSLVNFAIDVARDPAHARADAEDRERDLRDTSVLATASESVSHDLGADSSHYVGESHTHDVSHTDTTIPGDTGNIAGCDVMV